MDAAYLILLTVGVLLLAGLAFEGAGRLTFLPRVTLLIVFGVAIGPSGFDLLPIAIEEWYPLFADIALLMVGFLLGGKLSRQVLRESGRQVLWISVLEVFGVTCAVFLGLAALGIDPVLALLLAGMGPASAPAAITSVVDEVRAKGRFTDILLGIVALDDVWGLVVFSVFLAGAQALSGDGGAVTALRYGAWELGGALLVGLALGMPAAYLTGRIEPGEPSQTEALAVVFLCGGLALYLEVSFLLAAMVTGAVIVNLAHHHARPFREIKNIEWPFMVLFFVLAGASLEVETLRQIGSIGLAYIVLRIAGLVVGGWLGGLVGRAEAAHRRWIGLAITPQAGVALGMALVAGSRFPELKDSLLAVIIGTTVVFEVSGPVLTRFALMRLGEGKPR